MTRKKGGTIGLAPAWVKLGLVAPTVAEMETANSIDQDLAADFADFADGI
jgi:hypothetical protein